MAVEQKRFRSRVAADVDGAYDEIIGALVEDAKTAKRVVWVNCPHCKRKSSVEVDSASERLKAASFLAEHGFGRPPSSGDGAKAEPVKVVYKVVLGGDGSPRVSS